jgi:hypothetical protein
MTYDGIREDLRGIVGWLEGTDEAGWRYQTESAGECLREMDRLCAPVADPSKAASRAAPAPIYDPATVKVRAARPHVLRMISAMAAHDRAQAVVHGKRALTEL